MSADGPSFVFPGDPSLLLSWEGPTATSPHTGRQLRRISLVMSVPRDVHQEVAQALATAANDGPLIRATDDTSWKVGNYSYYRELDIFTYEVELIEHEPPPSSSSQATYAGDPASS